MVRQQIQNSKRIVQYDCPKCLKHIGNAHSGIVVITENWVNVGTVALIICISMRHNL